MSERAMQAAALMGLDLESGQRKAEGGNEAAAGAAAAILDAHAPMTVILGPSGAGKTTLLRRAAREARRRGMRVACVGVAGMREARLRERPLVDLLADSAEDAMRLLARAGLGEASCFLRLPAALSAGEMFRLKVALAMDRLGGARSTHHPPTGDRRPGVMIIDEFAGALDTETARSVAALLRRWVGRAPALRAVVATHREEVLPALGPARVVEVGFGGVVETRETKRTNTRKTKGVRIGRGTMEDYAALARMHYRAGRPATVVRVLAARRGSTLAGVLVVSMPTLNGWWRARAWPGEFDIPDKREGARRINDARRGVRCISRVIVDPRFRSTGIASALVRAYLDDPLTERTEAVAAMGRASRFFEEAGMTRIDLPMRPENARLTDLLEQFGIQWWEAASPKRMLEKACARGTPGPAAGSPFRPSTRTAGTGPARSSAASPSRRARVRSPSCRAS